MTALSTDAIRDRFTRDKPAERLVISPLLDEAGQAKVGQASVDIRLGFDFCLVMASSIGSISEFPQHGVQPSSLAKLYRREYVPFGSSIIIHPHQFMLAQTLEYIRLPSDLMASVFGRSTWGRLGLIVATAVGVHPNFAGNLTFELRNLGETPLTLYPGQTIAQLFIYNVTDRKGDPEKRAPKHSQYTGTIDMVPRRISSDTTHNTLKRLIKRFDKASHV